MPDHMGPVLVIGATGQQGGATVRASRHLGPAGLHPGLMGLETWLRATGWRP